jgi:hypothetical protein
VEQTAVLYKSMEIKMGKMCLIQWNPGNTTNHVTDVGWSCYRGGRVSEVENLNFMIT